VPLASGLSFAWISCSVGGFFVGFSEHAANAIAPAMMPTVVERSDVMMASGCF
jgi:hypothetical protein